MNIVNITEDIIKALRETEFGWLSPKGEILVCRSQRHIATLAESGYHTDWFNQRIAPMQEAVFLAREEHSERCSQWHNYSYEDMDNVCTKEEYAFVHKAYQDGWIRLGIIGYKFLLEGAGLKSVLDRNKKSLEDLAMMLNFHYEPYVSEIGIQNAFSISHEELSRFPDILEKCQMAFSPLPEKFRVDWDSQVSNEVSVTASRQAVQEAIQKSCLYITQWRPRRDFESTMVKIQTSDLSWVPEKLIQDISYHAGLHHIPIEPPNFSWNSEECGFTPGEDNKEPDFKS